MSETLVYHTENPIVRSEYLVTTSPEDVVKLLQLDNNQVSQWLSGQLTELGIRSEGNWWVDEMENKDICLQRQDDEGYFMIGKDLRTGEIDRVYAINFVTEQISMMNWRQNEWRKLELLPYPPKTSTRWL